jgi:flagellar hook assembly protein FlgD
VRSFEPRDVETGVHTLSWDARDDHGAAVAAGVYFVRFAGGGTAVTRRVEIVR